MKKFIHGRFNNHIASTEQSIREHFNVSTEIALYGLDPKGEVESLLNKFPKYAKVKPTSCTSSKSFKKHGIYSEKIDSDVLETHKTYGVYISISPINAVTGQLNEAGKKRVDKFIEVLKREGYLQQ